MDNLRTKICQCGHCMTAEDIKPPFERVPVGFYGGIVKKFSEATCECGRKYKLYLKPVPHSWAVVDMEPAEDEKPDYTVMTNAALIAILTERGIEIPKKATKADLISLIEGM